MGPKVRDLLGKVLRAMSYRVVIIHVSQQEYRSKCAHACAKGKGWGKGRGSTSGGQGPPQEFASMEISSNDVPALRFMKRKRCER